MIFSHTEPRNETSDQTELLNTKYLSNCLYVLEGRGGKEGQEGGGSFYSSKSGEGASHCDQDLHQ